MDVDLQRASAIIIAVGAVLFLIAAFLPVSARVFPERSPERRLEHIAAARTMWSVGQVLFGLGALLTPTGTALLAAAARGGATAQLLTASTILLLAAAGLWAWHVYQRGVAPASFTSGSLPTWPVLTYFVVTEVALAVYGIAWLRIDLPAWVGWLTIASMGALLALTVAFRDMIPAAYYLVTLVTAVMLW